MGGRLLVTGASGFVGRALSASLLKNNVLLTLTSRAPAAPEVVAIGELGISTDWTSSLRQCDTVVHLAARVHVMRDTAADPLAAFRAVNVDGTLSLARQAAAAGVKRFVFISSIGVNGSQTAPGESFSEADRAQPHNAYACSKWEAEQGLLRVASETGLEVAIIRPPLVYGANAPGNFGSLLRAVQRGYPLPLGAVHNQRSLVALDNLVDFIILCTTHPLAANQTFLVSDGQDMSTTQLVRGMAQAAGVSDRLLPVPVPLVRAAASLLGKTDAVDRLCGNLQVDISKARRLLDWSPSVSVQEGLRRTVAQWRK
jgi:nucleoside-diphosphate-sugar epimerase